MNFTADLLEEMEILCHYNLATTQEGVKVHRTLAPAAAVAAAQRLHDKGLITQPDGGYLTSLGLETAAHAQALLAVLRVA